MTKPGVAAAAMCAMLVALAACDGSSGTIAPSPTSSATTTNAPDVSEHESGPESPLTYGLQVPKGASQLGPLVRYRSARLITAYEPELRAALAQKAAEDRDKAAEAEREDTPLPSTVPTPDTRPSDDTFKLIDEPPKPDTTISLMRIDGQPTIVVRRMIAQIAALLPDTGVVTDNLAKYCRAVERRITSCRLAVRGLTREDRDVRVTMTVDPGNVRTRTAPPANLTKPAMTVTIEYVGEPRKGQLTRESTELGDVADVDAEPETSGLIWPKMDEDAPATTPLVGGWVAPSPPTTILLAGFRPRFVAFTTEKAADADLIAEQFVATKSEDGEVVKDVVEDLNAVATTYTAVTTDGSIARATYVLSARGNYTMMFYTPGQS